MTKKTQSLEKFQQRNTAFWMVTQSQITHKLQSTAKNFEAQTLAQNYKSKEDDMMM
jgi:hypothetical protein